MGVILSKFRKEKTTYEILEDLETKIKDIESYTISTQERQKRFVGNFLVISIGLYVISSIIFYFAFFPSTWAKRIVYSTPLLIFPILIIFLKRLVAWFFQRKLNRNANQLKTLRAEKKKIIEQVMEKETYKVALEILTRFADNSAKLQHQQMTGALRTPISTANQSMVSGNSAVTPFKVPQNPQTISPTPASSVYAQSTRPVPRTPINTRSMSLSSAAAPSGSPVGRNIPPYTGTGSAFGGTPTPFALQREVAVPKQITPYPIINQNQKGLFEKVVDYLIGDGPSSRYGMICKECYEHNGMVSQEEYDYSAFKCAFCHAYNPAKKLRPSAPKIPIPSQPGLVGDQSFGVSRSVLLGQNEKESASSTSTSDKDSSSDSELTSMDEIKQLKDNQTNDEKLKQDIETITEPVESVNILELPEESSATSENDETAASQEQSKQSEEKLSSEPKSEIDKKNE